MFKRISQIGLVCVAVATSGVTTAQQNDLRSLSDEQVRQRMIGESIADHAGECACPYSRASNGRRCGRTSAYSRSGGQAPLCYVDDIDYRMLQNYRRRVRKPAPR